MSLGYAGRNKTVILTATPQVVADYNPYRHGLFLYNDAGADCKLAFGFNPAPEDFFVLGDGKQLDLVEIAPCGPVWAVGAGPLHLMDNAVEGSTVGWTPAALLPAVPDGKTLWFDLSDASTVFEDSAATIPATIGGTVRLVLDKSGNGNGMALVGGTPPTWTGEGLDFRFGWANFVLPSFAEADWTYNQSSGHTFTVLGALPREKTGAARQYILDTGSHTSGRAGYAIAFDEGEYTLTSKPHWRCMVNGQTTYTPKGFEGVTVGAPVVIGTSTAFRSEFVSNTTLSRNLVAVNSADSRITSNPLPSPMYFFSYENTEAETFSGEFKGLFIQHTDAFVQEDYIRLQRWMATKLSVEV